jgi:hypothetical protein
METVCPHCRKVIQWCWNRSVVYPEVDEGEQERGEIQCTHCEEFVVVD